MRYRHDRSLLPDRGVHARKAQLVPIAGSAPVDRLMSSMTANRWRPVALATLRAGTSDQLALAAAGCAFFATLALFPAMSTLIALYGLLASPRLLEHQILWLHDLLPGPAFWLIANRLA